MYHVSYRHESFSEYPHLSQLITGSVAVTGTRFSNGKKRVAYSSVNCTGAESSLGDCDRYVHDINDPIQGWYDSTRAGVECQAFFDPGTNLHAIVPC